MALVLPGYFGSDEYKTGSEGIRNGALGLGALSATGGLASLGMAEIAKQKAQPILDKAAALAQNAPMRDGHIDFTSLARQIAPAQSAASKIRGGRIAGAVLLGGGLLGAVPTLLHMNAQKKQEEARNIVAALDSYQQ
jgi:hypothetical protein